jgi:hypothetical protein
VGDGGCFLLLPRDNSGAIASDGRRQPQDSRGWWKACRVDWASTRGRIVIRPYDVLAALCASSAGRERIEVRGVSLGERHDATPLFSIRDGDCVIGRGKRRPYD